MTITRVNVRHVLGNFLLDVGQENLRDIEQAEEIVNHALNGPYPLDSSAKIAARVDDIAGPLQAGLIAKALAALIITKEVSLT